MWNEEFEMNYIQTIQNSNLHIPHFKFQIPHS
jgi:hypothetical protein